MRFTLSICLLFRGPNCKWELHPTLFQGRRDPPPLLVPRPSSADLALRDGDLRPTDGGHDEVPLEEDRRDPAELSGDAPQALPGWKLRRR